jgi:hypothetical protein
MKDSEKKKQKLNNFAQYTSIAFQMMIIIAAGTFAGYKLDIWFGLKFPVFLIILSVASVGIAIYHSVKDFL